MPACPGCGIDNPDVARFCHGCGSPIGAGRSSASGSRRVVTVLFSDVVGSTALGELLDPETMRGVMVRYFDSMARVIERHGGTVEKYIGDAIMAVFGLPVLHEDDALRAVRAAAEMRDALAELNLALEAERGVTIATRTGIETGVVVAGDVAARQTLVTGDAVNTAARLEQAAQPGEILVGLPAWRLVGGSATGEPVRPIEAKGKSEPVGAIRLLGIGREGDPRLRLGAAPLVGRSRELELLRTSFERVRRARDSALITVVGPAGVGKSRLVAEFIAGVADRATVLRGRCLSYGEGITYWPLREVLLAAAGITEGDAPESGRQKLEQLVRGARDGPLIAARLASAIGLSVEPAPQEELFWAARRTLEHLASERPLVVIIEDIHWAEATLLELIEHIVDLGRDAPLLIVCPARPEVRDTVPGWGRDRRNAIEIVLEGLSGDATVGLIDALPGGSAIPAGLRTRILATAEGNPLFLEEMVRMLVDDGILTVAGGPRTGDPAVLAQVADSVLVPPTIGALIAARLDQLPGDERSTAQRASVAGRVFERSAVAALTPPTALVDVTASLAALVRRELVAPAPSEFTADEAFKFRAPAPSEFTADEAFKFRHILIRDAAYEALAKADRADLHERFADWLEHVSSERLMEYEAILGHHLGQAHRYRTELRERGEHTVQLAERAVRHLVAAARRARDRGDSAAAVDLFAQADGLPVEDLLLRAEIAVHHGLALWDLGRLAEALERAERALEFATETADRRLAARARLLRLDVWIADSSYAKADAFVGSELAAAVSDAEASGDPLARAYARLALSVRAWNERRFSDSEVETRLAARHARDAGDSRLELEIECEILPSMISGPATASHTRALAEGLLSRATSYPSVRARILNQIAIPEAMLGLAGQARAHADEAMAIYRDLAQPQGIADVHVNRHWVARLDGDLDTAEAELRTNLRSGDFDAIGRAFATSRLVEVLLAQGRIDEADQVLVEVERDPIPLIGPRLAACRAQIDAARRNPGAAAKVDKLLAMVADTPFINQQTDAFLAAAEAMLSLGDTTAATAHARRALELAEAKENVALAAQIRLVLARLAGQP